MKYFNIYNSRNYSKVFHALLSFYCVKNSPEVLSSSPRFPSIKSFFYFSPSLFIYTCRKLYNTTEAKSCFSMLDRFHIYPFFITSFHSQ